VAATRLRSSQAPPVLVWQPRQEAFSKPTFQSAPPEVRYIDEMPGAHSAVAATFPVCSSPEPAFSKPLRASERAPDETRATSCVWVRQRGGSACGLPWAARACIRAVVQTPRSGHYPVCASARRPARPTGRPSARPAPGPEARRCWRRGLPPLARAGAWRRACAPRAAGARAPRPRAACAGRHHRGAGAPGRARRLPTCTQAGRGGAARGAAWLAGTPLLHTGAHINSARGCCSCCCRAGGGPRRRWHPCSRAAGRTAAASARVGAPRRRSHCWRPAAARPCARTGGRRAEERAL